MPKTVWKFCHKRYWRVTFERFTGNMGNEILNQIKISKLCFFINHLLRTIKIMKFVLYDNFFNASIGIFWDPGSRFWGFRIGIFNFGLDRKIPKIPKSRGSRSGFENPEKFRVKNHEISRIGIEIWKAGKIPKKSRVFS